MPCKAWPPHCAKSTAPLPPCFITQSRIFMIFGGCGLLVQTLVLRTLLG